MTTKTCRPWIVLVSDLRRYLGRACDALDSNLARVIFFEARIGKKKERRWLMLMSIEVTWAQLVSANAAFAAGRARRVCLADLPPLTRERRRVVHQSRPRTRRPDPGGRRLDSSWPARGRGFAEPNRILRTRLNRERFP